jgi:hypothetical protein
VIELDDRDRGDGCSRRLGDKSSVWYSVRCFRRYENVRYTRTDRFPLRLISATTEKMPASQESPQSGTGVVIVQTRPLAQEVSVDYRG